MPTVLSIVGVVLRLLLAVAIMILVVYRDKFKDGDRLLLVFIAIGMSFLLAWSCFG